MLRLIDFYDAKSIPVRGDQWMISPFNINQLPGRKVTKTKKNVNR